MKGMFVCSVALFGVISLLYSGVCEAASKGGSYGVNNHQFCPPGTNEWHCHPNCRYQIEEPTNECVQASGQDTCFGVAINYKFVNDSFDRSLIEPFKHFAKFPKCWSFLEPLLCAVAFRPCSKRRYLEEMMAEGGVMELREVFPLQLCTDAETHCKDIMGSNMWPHFVKCHDYPQTNISLVQNTGLSKYRRYLFAEHGWCKVNYNNTFATHSLKSTSCQWPYVMKGDGEESTIEPIQDACYLPGISSFYDNIEQYHAFNASVGVFCVFCIVVMGLAVYYLHFKAHVINESYILFVLSTMIGALILYYSIYLAGTTGLWNTTTQFSSNLRKRSSSLGGSGDLCVLQADLLLLLEFFAYNGFCFVVLCSITRPKFAFTSNYLTLRSGGSGKNRNAKISSKLFYLGVNAILSIVMLIPTIQSGAVTVTGVYGVCNVGSLDSHLSKFRFMPLAIVITLTVIFLSLYFVKHSLVVYNLKKTTTNAPYITPFEAKLERVQEWIANAQDKELRRTQSIKSLNSIHFESVTFWSMNLFWILYGVFIILVFFIGATFLQSALILGEPIEAAKINKLQQCVLEKQILGSWDYGEVPISDTNPLTRKSMLPADYFDGCAKLPSLKGQLFPLFFLFLVFPLVPVLPFLSALLVSLVWRGDVGMNEITLNAAKKRKLREGMIFVDAMPRGDIGSGELGASSFINIEETNSLIPICQVGTTISDPKVQPAKNDLFAVDRPEITKIDEVFQQISNDPQLTPQQKTFQRKEVISKMIVDCLAKMQREQLIDRCNFYNTRYNYNQMLAFDHNAPPPNHQDQIRFPTAAEAGLFYPMTFAEVACIDTEYSEMEEEFTPAQIIYNMWLEFDASDMTHLYDNGMSHISVFKKAPNGRYVFLETTSTYKDDAIEKEVYDVLRDNPPQHNPFHEHYESPTYMNDQPIAMNSAQLVQFIHSQPDIFPRHYFGEIEKCDSHAIIRFYFPNNRLYVSYYPPNTLMAMIHNLQLSCQRIMSPTTIDPFGQNYHLMLHVLQMFSIIVDHNPLFYGDISEALLSEQTRTLYLHSDLYKHILPYLVDIETYSVQSDLFTPVYLEDNLSMNIKRLANVVRQRYTVEGDVRLVFQMDSRGSVFVERFNMNLLPHILGYMIDDREPFKRGVIEKVFGIYNARRNHPRHHGPDGSVRPEDTEIYHLYQAVTETITDAIYARNPKLKVFETELLSLVRTYRTNFRIEEDREGDRRNRGGLVGQEQEAEEDLMDHFEEANGQEDDEGTDDGFNSANSDNEHGGNEEDMDPEEEFDDEEGQETEGEEENMNQD
uniref:G_PROTEIN_RECEP_F2_4 domain-containing protein n=1 Tax=Rhabditophanes sp. KR3021 TaxID=114890 RepID=A0AC35U296_9BILA